METGAERMRDGDGSHAGDRYAHLWRRWRDDGDVAARDELVVAHLGLAHSLAARYRGGVEPFDDLRQVAALALLKAVNRFDPDQGGPFTAYLTPTVLGELKRHFRDHGWSVHVNRALKERALLVKTTQARLSREHPRVTAQMIAEELDLSLEEVVEASTAITSQYAASLEPPEDDTDPAPDLVRAFGVADAGYAEVEARDLMKRLTADLSERDRQILLLRFEGGLSQSEIAARVGISQMQVSRVLRNTLKGLAPQLKASS